MATKAFMIDEVSGVLNNIEYFAMNFAHGVADDSVVYRSLHQSYIDIMQLLYFNISNLNNSSSDKYYLNAIELYNKWKLQKDKDTNEKKMMDITREAKNKGTIVNMENIWLLSIKEYTNIEWIKEVLLWMLEEQNFFNI